MAIGENRLNGNQIKTIAIMARQSIIYSKESI